MAKKREKPGSIQPIVGDASLDDYYCPYCGLVLIRGDVARLRMLCPNCNQFVDADAKDLIQQPDDLS